MDQGAKGLVFLTDASRAGEGRSFLEVETVRLSVVSDSKGMLGGSY